MCSDCIKHISFSLLEFKIKKIFTQTPFAYSLAYSQECMHLYTFFILEWFHFCSHRLRHVRMLLVWQLKCYISIHLSCAVIMYHFHFVVCGLQLIILSDFFCLSTLSLSSTEEEKWGLRVICLSPLTIWSGPAELLWHPPHWFPSLRLFWPSHLLFFWFFVTFFSNHFTA